MKRTDRMKGKAECAKLLGGLQVVKINHELRSPSNTPQLACKQGAGGLIALAAVRQARSRKCWYV